MLTIENALQYAATILPEGVTIETAAFTDEHEFPVIIVTGFGPPDFGTFKMDVWTETDGTIYGEY